jgi:hypothetical protein
VGSASCSIFVIRKKSEEVGSRDFNLKKHLKDELSKEKRDYFDVVAFTHGDNDHICNSTEFFGLDQRTGHVVSIRSQKSQRINDDTG